MIWNILGTFGSFKHSKMREEDELDTSTPAGVRCVKTTFDFQDDFRTRPRRLQQLLGTARDVRRCLTPVYQGVEAIFFLLVALADLGTTWANCTAYSISLYKNVTIEQCMYVMCCLASVIFIWEVLLFCRTVDILCRKRRLVRRMRQTRNGREINLRDPEEAEVVDKVQEEPEKGEGERRGSIQDAVTPPEYRVIDTVMKRFTVSFFEVLLHDMFISVLSATRCQLTETDPVLIVSVMTTLTCVCARVFHNICLHTFLRCKYSERRFKYYQPSACIKGWMLLAMVAVLIFHAVTISRLTSARNPAILVSDTVVVEKPITDRFYKPLYFKKVAKVNAATSKRLTTTSDVRQHGEAMIFTEQCLDFSQSRLYYDNRSYSLQDLAGSCGNNCTLILQIRYEKVVPDSPRYLYNAWQRTECDNQVFYTEYGRNGTSLEHLGDGVTSPGLTVHIQGDFCNTAIRDPDMTIISGN
ncbi:hypothetical protein Bbelb_404140 [Branchiostoma belcheri]|nr:hypothetical protein Bbelb_404140 [Branchiostoma belcheri]